MGVQFGWNTQHLLWRGKEGRANAHQNATAAPTTGNAWVSDGNQRGDEHVAHRHRALPPICILGQRESVGLKYGEIEQNRRALHRLTALQWGRRRNGDDGDDGGQLRRSNWPQNAVTVKEIFP
jgi:hypothetical protein